VSSWLAGGLGCRLELSRSGGHLNACGPLAREGSSCATDPSAYPPEFHAEAVRLIRSSGKPLSKISKDLGVSEQRLRVWIKQGDLDEGRRDDGLTSAEQEELRQLRRKVRVLEEEREILKKAAAFFARETDHRS
jgi:transposase